MVDRNNPMEKLHTECKFNTTRISRATSKLVDERKFNQTTQIDNYSSIGSHHHEIMLGLIVALKKVIKNIQEKLKLRQIQNRHNMGDYSDRIYDAVMNPTNSATCKNQNMQNEHINNTSI